MKDFNCCPFLEVIIFLIALVAMFAGALEL